MRSTDCLKSTCGCGLLCLYSLVAANPAVAQLNKPKPPESIVNLLQNKCFDCHSDGEGKGNLLLDDLLRQTSAETYPVWWRVLNNVRAGTMPPPDSGAALTEDEKKELFHWLKYSAMAIDVDHPDPGKVLAKRLTRREYANTIQDLTGVDFNADVVFPPDDSSSGFDNVGDAQSLSPVLIEKYLAAASDIIEQAVPKVSKVIPTKRIGPKDLRGDSGNAENMRANKQHVVGGSVSLEHDGQYTVELRIKSHGSFDFNPQRCTFEFKLDGESLHQAEYGWNEAKRQAYSFQRTMTAGSHHLEIRIQPISLPDNATATPDSWVEIDLDQINILGPSHREKWNHPPGYKAFFDRDEPPTDRAEQREYAKQVLDRFALRTFRRPTDEKTLQRLVDLAESVYSRNGQTFESGVAQAMVPMLASPRFLFRIDTSEASSRSERYPLIDEYSLASRLSYFLWSTMPDEQLFKLASTGQLRANLDSQVQRMLADPRCSALTDNFVGQWLRTRDVEKISIDVLSVLGLKEEYEKLQTEFRARRGRRTRTAEPRDPETEKVLARFRGMSEKRDILDAEMRIAMRRETEMLFNRVLSENRSILEIVAPNYTYANEKLARHYGIPNVTGKQMRLVELDSASPRGGILAQGTMLLVTSNPTRTSPVKRGLFVLENILGTPTPPAPPNVPPLEDSVGKFGDRKPSLREVLEIHRESPLCNSCHSRMDPLGLALENFDAIGQWRDNDGENPIDAAGKLITGEAFSNIQELKATIVGPRRMDFYRCFSQKMLTYALGRGLDYYDEHTLDQLVSKLESHEGRLQALIIAIIQSAPFQRQRQPTSNSTAGIAK
jgi:Protein of unknown function (DUF1592)/Protein of unknown function (DUF1588)/Protein of unknown function (DUF1587)/Protein of unknown function (DUF1585)/Protein of unknown function (DUF1595)/Planctomycete cytochrome C